MSLVYQRFFTLSLPTVAAVLGILWLRNRRKGRHLLVDKTGDSFPNKAEEESHRDKLILVCDTNVEDNNIADNTCMSVEDTVINTIEFGSTLNTTCESELCKNSEESFISTNTSKGIEVVPITEKSISDIKTESGLIDQLDPTPVKEIHNSSENLYITESKDIADIAVKLEEIQLPVAEKVNSEIKTCSILSSELEEENIQVRNIQEGVEGEMKKEKEQIKENLNTLELDKMKETGQLAEKLASLELDQMKMDERKSGSERDSANHSPSEIMLASPSISNFSDAHSEGSSDSGKGQSDGATSPSRTPAGTPAGGSSLAGDQAPSVYEFILPQVIVGRLIGRHGVFLNEIKTQTHTNIFIKRHPDSNKLKVCAIEGTQQDIDKALAKIRQKFPLRRFPQLTLDKVSFVQVNPLPPLKPEDFHLQLVEGVNNDVVLSSLISAAHFFLQQPCHPSYTSLAALNSIMTQIYSSGEAPILETPVNYAVCAAPAMEGWYRAQIVQVEEDGLHCTVRYLDYGGYSRIAASELRQIRGDLLALPFQAVECYLANVAPPPGEDWSEEARMFVHSLTCGQILHAQVYDYAEDGAPLVYLYSSIGTQVVLINEELVVHGYAVISENGSTCGTTSEDGGRTDEEGTKSEKETEE